MAPPLPGTQFGHYQIVSALGEGGMGVVYRARDTRLERDVALKLLAEGPSKEARDRLVAEARAASALNHANVATIYEVGEAEGRSYIAMEHVAGRPLSKMIPPEGLPAENVIRYGMQIAGALAHAHERGVIHRDLKSANVVITPEGHPKVLDFGLAARLSHDELHGVTRSIEAIEKMSSVAGTLHYMAPEVLRGEPADARSDIWALGVVLHEMAAGRLPFEGRTGFELTSAILRESPQPLPAHVPPGIRGVIQRCLAKDPGHRYRSAEQVHAALEALSSDTAITPVVPIPEAKPRRIPRWAVITGAAVVVAALLYAGRFALTTRNQGDEGRERIPSAGGAGTPAAGGPTGKEMSALAIQRPSANAEASELLQRSIMYTRYQLDPLRARQMIEQALKLDPKFTEARLNYALTYIIAVDLGISNDSGDIYRAEEEVRRALAEDPSLSRAHALLGAVHFYQGRGDLAFEQFQQSLKLDPNDIGGRMWMMRYSKFRGDTEEAIRIGRELVKQQPLLWPARHFLGEIFREQGKLADAVREQEKVLEQDPQNVSATRALARAYLDTGNLPRARQALEQLRPQDRKNFHVRLTRAQLNALEGKQALARKEIDESVLKYADVSPLATLDLAETYALLGETEKALDWLDRDFRRGDDRLEFIRRDPLLANIRKEPRFKQIVDSITFRRQQRAR